MKKIKGIFLKVASSVAALAFLVAVSSVGVTCWFTAYQPEVPESLREK